MEHWKNLSLENIIEEFEGVVYTEEWKDVIITKFGITHFFSGFYKVSSFGRVKTLGNGFSNNSKKEKILVLSNSNTRKYLSVKFSKNNSVIRCYVHVLVGQNFIPNTENKPEVNHKKGVKTDNRFHQLEWSTKSENSKHAFDTGLSVSPKAHLGKKGALNHISKKVSQFSLDGNLINKFSSITEAVKKTGITNVSISCRTGVVTKGYLWKYTM